MNLIPVALTAAVVAAVPPLRRRVVPVASASASALVGTGYATVASAATVAFTAAEGLVGIGRAVVQGPPAADGAAA